MNADFDTLRVKMVDGQVRTTDVTEPALISALLTVPREAFVPARRKPIAYIDEDIELVPAEGGNPARFLMEPSPFARLAQLARIGRDDVVLDVGCGTGYSAAVFSRLAGSVIALESSSDLVSSATETLSGLGYDNIAVVEGPLEAGFPSEAPYDVIFVGGAVDFVPPALFEQLRQGGRLVVVEGQGNAGRAMLYVRDGDNTSGRHAFNAAVKPLPGFQREPAFQF